MWAPSGGRWVVAMAGTVAGAARCGEWVDPGGRSGGSLEDMNQAHWRPRRQRGRYVDSRQNIGGAGRGPLALTGV
jgi:hypothetical protein